MNLLCETVMFSMNYDDAFCIPIKYCMASFVYPGGCGPYSPKREMPSNNAALTHADAKPNEWDSFSTLYIDRSVGRPL